MAVEAIDGEVILDLPPMLWGYIRWSKSIGHPIGPFELGFSVKAEEHTPTEWRALGGGKYEPIPGTGIWKTLSASVPCQRLPDDVDDYVVGFSVPGVHNTVLDGRFRVSVMLSGRWSTSGVDWFVRGRRRVEPSAALVELPKGNHIKTLEFRVTRRESLWSLWEYHLQRG
jgi:hypothetical protein